MGLNERGRRVGAPVVEETSALGALLDACERLESEENLSSAPQVKLAPNSPGPLGGRVPTVDVGLVRAGGEHQLVAPDGFAPVSRTDLPTMAPRGLGQEAHPAMDALRTAATDQSALSMASSPAGAGRDIPSSTEHFRVPSGGHSTTAVLSGSSYHFQHEWMGSQSSRAPPSRYLDDTRSDMPPDAAAAIRLSRTKELDVPSVLALVRHRDYLDFKPRPWNIGEDKSGELPPARIYAEVTSTHRRKHSREQKCDEWRNNGGKKGVVCQKVPKELLRTGEPQLTVARRQGKIRRPGLPDLRYQQFNVSADERPLAKSGPIILYHVVPQRYDDLPPAPVRTPRQPSHLDEPRWRSFGQLNSRKRQKHTADNVQLPAVVTFPSMQCGCANADKTPTKAPLGSTPPTSSSNPVVTQRDDGGDSAPADEDRPRTPPPRAHDTSRGSSTAVVAAKDDPLARSEPGRDSEATESTSSRESPQRDGPGNENGTSTTGMKISEFLGKRKATGPLTEVELNDMHRAVRNLHVYVVTQGGQCRQVIVESTKRSEASTDESSDRKLQQTQHGSQQLQHKPVEQQHQRHHFQQQQQQQQQIHQQQIQQLQHFQHLQHLQLLQQQQQQQQQSQQQQQQPQQQQQHLAHPMLHQLQQQHQFHELQQQLEILRRQQQQKQQLAAV